MRVGMEGGGGWSSTVLSDPEWAETPTLGNNQSRGKKMLGGSSHFNFC